MYIAIGMRQVHYYQRCCHSSAISKSGKPPSYITVTKCIQMFKSYMGKFLYQYIMPMHEMFPGRIFDWTVETGDPSEGDGVDVMMYPSLWPQSSEYVGQRTRRCPLRSS